MKQTGAWESFCPLMGAQATGHIHSVFYHFLSGELSRKNHMTSNKLVLLGGVPSTWLLLGCYRCWYIFLQNLSP